MGMQVNLNAPQPPRWLSGGAWGGHAQSIAPSLFSHKPACAWARQRWEWDDGDFCDADWLHTKSPSAPLLVLFHGLESSSNSHYARSIGAHFLSQGWRVVVPHFRGCSGEPNRLLRAYHSGDAAEIGRMLGKAQAAFPHAPLHAAGVSLGGNALLCYLSQNHLPTALKSAAAVCAPLDLGRCGDAITQGFAHVYTLMFMRTLRTKALAKQVLFPNACDWAGIRRSRNLFEFDGVFTAPIHGYQSALDYYARASAKPKLATIDTPTLLLNALNDPFVPRDIVADLAVSPRVTVQHTQQGGHVGFAQQSAQGGLFGQLNWLPQRLHAWFTHDALGA